MNIGIDLGTTNSCAGYMTEFGNIEFIRFENNSMILPSCLYYDRGKIVTGRKAIEMSEKNPSNFISCSKTFMDDKTKIWAIEGKRFKPEDCSFEILKAVRKELQNSFGNEKQFDAVITVPAKFGEDQIRKTAAAAKRAGFVLKEIIKEPVAAVLAFNDSNFKPGDKVFVLDFGGGTIDAAMVELKGSTGVTDFNVISADGNRHLGGKDLDEVICRMILEKFMECSGQNLLDSETSFGKTRKFIRRKIEKISGELKISLFENVQNNISSVSADIDDLCSICENKDNCPYSEHFSFELNFDEYIAKAEDVYSKMTDLILNDKFISARPDHVLFVGGMSRDPYLRQFIESTFSESNVIYAPNGNGIAENEKYMAVIARGAAIKACDDSIHIVNKILNSLGIICRKKDGSEYMDTIIESGTDIDENFVCRHTYTNTGRFETELKFDIYEYNGDPDNMDDLEYRKLGSFVFNDIDPMDSGKQRIEASFSFNREGMLCIEALDLNNNGKSIDVCIEI